MKPKFTSLFFISMVFMMRIPSFAQYQFQSPCSQLIWEDNFDGTSLDGAKWTAQIGDGCDINLCGWGNNEQQYYTDRPENLKVENGKLVITALKESYSGKNYTSARIRSKNKGDFTFGRIEARIKLPQGAGSWPAFWMLPTDEVYGAWPQSGEIDIMEFQGKTPTFVSGTAHYGGVYPDHKFRGLIKTLPVGQYYYEDFHDFAIEWDSTTIRWYMDGSLYHTFTDISILPYDWPFDQRFHLIINNAIGGHLGGTVDDASFPQIMEIDYVKVYSVPFNRSMKGPIRVYENSANIEYSLPGDPFNLDTYLWTVPSGVTINSGQGTSSINVTWGAVSSAGDVNLNLTTSCDVFDLNYPVTVYQDNCEVYLENFENDSKITLKQKSGSYVTAFANPMPSGINTSSKVLRYKRNIEQEYDAVVYKNVLSDDIREYETSNKYLYLDILTNAPIGTSITLQLQNSGRSYHNDYPIGIRSTFTSQTTVQGQWERHRFSFDRMDDPSILSNDIDEFVLCLDPGHYTNDYYYIDNIKRMKVQDGCIIDAVIDQNNAEQLTYYPNPSQDKITLEWNTLSSLAEIKITDVMGNVVTKKQVFDANSCEINVQDLKAGTYYIHLIIDQQSAVKQLMKL